ncbi:MAG TPA: hypothetical protein VKB26_05550, partial [Candidatus Acidoferrales bacterium]|nr:hypothetical protein [Candidatus Acidoferrales bacterium]
IVFIGIGALVFILTWAIHRPALAVVIFLVLGVATAIAYRMSLGRVDGLAMRHRETLATELCRQE